MTKKESKNRNTTKRKKKVQTNHEGKTSIHIGDISGGTGFAIGPRAQASVTQTRGLGIDEIADAFNMLQQKVEGLPQGSDKNIAENAVKALEAEARKGEQATENTVQKWLKFLAETAPDVWDVAIDTFTNPIKGVGTVFKKIADRAKAERDAKKAEASKKR